MELIDNTRGFGFIPGNTYLNQVANAELAFDHFQKSYNDSLAPDGVRNRSYLKLSWDRPSNRITVSENQNYFQSANSNIDDGGKIRRFATIDPDILNSPIMQSILAKNIEFISSYAPLSNHDDLTLGIHFIQYIAEEMGASYSSPVGLHVDDEPLVFVHLVELTPNALGGDNLIARLSDQEITNVIRLKNKLDTLCLTQQTYHAVTPLGSDSATARRDVILFTIEPGYTQK